MLEKMNEQQRMLREIEREVKLTQRYTGIQAFDERVMAVMGQVPRHRFVPRELRACAYENGPVPIGEGQTISQPYIVALMTDLIKPRAEHIVLEVGTGSCYQAAILSKLVQRVYSIEIIEILGKKACQRLRKLGYDNVEVRVGDGYYGWKAHAPFDGIIVTAAAPYIPRPLIEQLREGGRLVIPVGLPYMHQELMVVEKKKNGEIETRDILAVAFVPLTGDRGEKKPAGNKSRGST